jgi:glutaredoxin
LATASSGERGPVSDGLTLLTRAYCHLCDDMRAALEPIAARAGVAIVEIDVDADPALEAKFGERVPVLLYAGIALCHYTLDAKRVQEALRK